jgi:hypothetical protein
MGRLEVQEVTHDELLELINHKVWLLEAGGAKTWLPEMKALRAVVELHKPLPIVNGDGAENCCWCQIAGIRETPYPCPTIKAIMEQLK